MIVKIDMESHRMQNRCYIHTERGGIKCTFIVFLTQACVDKYLLKILTFANKDGQSDI